jgi:MFS transporter, AAHS family, 3-hydroxyphenylpropionic acid transporter
MTQTAVSQAIGRHWGTSATIAGCVAVAFCEGFDLQAAGVAAGGIVSELRPTSGELGTFFSASTLGLFVGALLGGRLSDSLGRKRILLGSIVLFGLFSVLTAAARDIQALSWARLVTGGGLGGVFPTLLALVSESSSTRRRNINVALVYSGMPFGGAIASLVSMLTAPEHWRLIFIAGGVIPLALIPLLHRVLRESSEFERSAAAAVATAGTLGFETLHKTGNFLAILAGGRAATTLLLWISSFLELLTLYLILSWLPLLLVGSGFTKSEAAGVQVAFNVGGALAALGIGPLLESSARNLSIIAAFLSVPLFILLLSHSPSQLALVTLIVFGMGGSVLAAQSFLYATAPRCYPTLIRGAALGAAVAMGRVGSIVGPKLGGALKAAGHGSGQLFRDLLPLVVVASVTGLWFAWEASRSGCSQATDAGQCQDDKNAPN